MARNFVRVSQTSGDYIDCGNSASLNPANNLSVAAWIYPTSSTSGQIAHMYVSRDGGSSSRCYTLFRRAAGVLDEFRCEVFKNNTTATAISSTTVGNVNTWYHVCFTYEFVTDGTSRLRMYVNGVQETASTTAVGPLNQQTANNEIGRRPFPSFEFPCNAVLAEVAIYNATLSAGEVKSLAQGMSPDKVSPQGLVLYAPLVRELIDIKGNTLTNNGTTVAEHPRIYA